MPLYTEYTVEPCAGLNGGFPNLGVPFRGSPKSGLQYIGVPYISGKLPTKARPALWSYVPYTVMEQGT